MNITHITNCIESERVIPNNIFVVWSKVLQQVKILIRFTIFIAGVTWTLFLSAGLIVSIFGANLEQQKYASVHKIEASEYIHRACQSKSDIGIANNLSNKLDPDIAQCWGSNFY